MHPDASGRSSDFGLSQPFQFFHSAVVFPFILSAYPVLRILLSRRSNRTRVERGYNEGGRIFKGRGYHGRLRDHLQFRFSGPPIRIAKLTFIVSHTGKSSKNTPPDTSVTLSEHDRKDLSAGPAIRSEYPEPKFVTVHHHHMDLTEQIRGGLSANRTDENAAFHHWPVTLIIPLESVRRGRPSPCLDGKPPPSVPGRPLAGSSSGYGPDEPSDISPRTHRSSAAQSAALNRAFR